MLKRNMAYNVVFTEEAMKDLDKLDKKVLNRLIKKIKWFANQKSPLNFANQLKYPAIGEYRFRIGDYRVVFDCKKETLIILRIGHRSSVYQ